MQWADGFDFFAAWRIDQQKVSCTSDLVGAGCDSLQTFHYYF
jgi:hypothetical protein